MNLQREVSLFLYWNIIFLFLTPDTEVVQSGGAKHPEGREAGQKEIPPG